MDGPSPRLAVRTFGLTDPGRVRTSNQDSFLIAELTRALRIRQSSLPQPATQYSDERGYLFLVADGMGGHQGGEQASALAVVTIEAFVLNTLRWFFALKGPEEDNVLSEFQAALRQADARMFEVGAEHSELLGMGTTLTMAYSVNHHLYVVHVGDTRCYLARGGVLYRLTHDHTLVNELVRRGKLEPELAAQHPFRHVVTNAVGGTEKGIQTEAHRVELEPGDIMLLCSDGLTEMLSDKEINTILQDERAPDRACERLVGEANDRGGRDNVTAVVVHFDAVVGRRS